MYVQCTYFTIIHVYVQFISLYSVHACGIIFSKAFIGNPCIVYLHLELVYLLYTIVMSKKLSLGFITVH